MFRFKQSIFISILLFNASLAFCIPKPQLNRNTLIDAATFLATRSACSFVHEATHTLLAKCLIKEGSASLKSNLLINPSFKFTFNTEKTKIASLAAIYAAGPLAELAFSSLILQLRKKLPPNMPGSNGICWGAYSGIATSLAHALPLQLKIGGFKISSDSQKILNCHKE